jgi:hypothetical protein
MSNPHEISVQDAQAMLDAFKNNNSFANQPRGIYFDKDTILELLNQPNAVGIDYYFGLNNSNKLSLILIALDNQNNEIAIKIMDAGNLIPPNKPKSSPFIL